MSSQKGNLKKSGPPKYQNKRAFKNNLHDKTNKIKIINSLDMWGLCAPCKGVIEWKVKYKKYKPLSQPRTCVKCNQKTVKRAYYTVCQPCSESLKICGKCAKVKEIVEKIGLTPEEEASKQAQLGQELRSLPERKRRAFLRNATAGNHDKPEEEATGGKESDDDGDDDDVESDVGATDSDDEAAERSDEEIKSDEEEAALCGRSALADDEDESKQAPVDSNEKADHEHLKEDSLKALSLSEKD